MTKNVTNTGWGNIYSVTSLGLSVVFAVVGLIFLCKPDGAFLLFNNFSRQLDFAELPLQGFGLYHILAAGYMYLVTLLGYFMYKHPENRLLPILLINGKAASSLLSFFFFFYHCNSLLYLANGIIDGSIALGVLLLYRKTRTV